MHESLDPTCLNSVLERALEGNPEAWAELEPFIRRQLWRLAAAILLPPAQRSDFVDEVAQEVALAIVDAGPGVFDPSRASARTYLTAIARNCTARYMAFRPVVGKRRPRARNGREESVTSRVLRIEDMHEDDFRSLSHETWTEVEAALDAQAILDVAPELVAAALRGLHYEDRDQLEIAESLGVPRTTLMRRVDAFASRVRGIVAA